jgi:hypothetical protein
MVVPSYLRGPLHLYRGSTVEGQNDAQTFAQTNSSTANVLNVQPASSLRFAPGPIPASIITTATLLEQGDFTISRMRDEFHFTFHIGISTRIGFQQSPLTVDRRGFEDPRGSVCTPMDAHSCDRANNLLYLLGYFRFPQLMR